jgi:hypothetical protein
MIAMSTRGEPAHMMGHINQREIQCPRLTHQTVQHHGTEFTGGRRVRESGRHLQSDPEGGQGHCEHTGRAPRAAEHQVHHGGSTDTCQPRQRHT